MTSCDASNHRAHNGRRRGAGLLRLLRRTGAEPPADPRRAPGARREHLAAGCTPARGRAGARPGWRTRPLQPWLAERGLDVSLPDPDQRRRALAELVRVIAPGGLVAIALIPTCALLRRTLAIADERACLADQGFVDALLSRGQYATPTQGASPTARAWTRPRSATNWPPRASGRCCWAPPTALQPAWRTHWTRCAWTIRRLRGGDAPAHPHRARTQPARRRRAPVPPRHDRGL